MSERKYVKIVVLGDIGRSPRMQYHSKSLSDLGFQVDIVAYGDTEPMESIKTNPLIFYHYLCPVPTIPFAFFNYIFKTIFQAFNLLFLLLITTKCDILLMQNPPAIPSIVICWFYCKLIGSKFVIDWHNYAFSIMALKVGRMSNLVKLTRKLEQGFGSRADVNFCVTKAMKENLQKQFGIEAVTLYDRPAEIFKPISKPQKLEFLQQFYKKYNIEVAPEKVGVLVSSTSWTEDEDFSILLKSLQDYEDVIQNGNPRNLPPLLCVITGKGPLKNFYLKKIASNKFKNVSIATPWLDISEYPLLLASADLGISLHTSSSGFDLPMKVVDMFGCGLPVCAFNFNCLNELVKNEENGFTFTTSEELSQLILNWFEDFPNNPKQQDLEKKFKSNIDTFQKLRWKENWELVAAHYFVDYRHIYCLSSNKYQTDGATVSTSN